MTAKTRAQLCVMMFLQFFIWGAWYVTLSTYLGNSLGFSGADIGDAYSTVNWGAIVAPFIVGMIADRFFAAQKLLGVLHLLGAGLLYGTSTLVEPGPFFWALIGYALCYMPTLGLVNAIAFGQMQDPGKQFPAVRVLGTIGWIVAGIVISALALEASVMPLRIAALASLVMGLYSFALPSTPPRSSGKRVTVSDVLGLRALSLMRSRSFAVLVVASLLTCVPLAFYYAFTNQFLNNVGIENAAGKMGILGQGSEILFMLAMPFFLSRLGIKKTLLLGMAAWVARYVLFANGASGAPGSGHALLYLGLALHGICYDFFFVTGQIYVDRKAPAALRASAQGLITLATYGVGMLIGSMASGRIVDAYAGDWTRIWYVPAALAGVLGLVFLFAFQDDASAA